MAAVAARQHGVVSRAQLLAIGLGSRAVESRLAAGRLHATYRGVYAVGHARVTMRARWMAAVLASGLAAVLSHRAAAALQNIRRSEAIEVTTPQHRRARTGILLHQARLAPDGITTVDGIPVTTVFRTLIDLAAVLPRHSSSAPSTRPSGSRSPNPSPSVPSSRATATAEG